MSVQYFSPITEANYGGNTTVNTSTYVRAYNNDDNAHLIAITTGPITIGSFYKKRTNTPSKCSC